MRDFHLASALAQHFDLTYAFFGTAEAQRELENSLHHVIAVPPPPKYTKSKLIRGLLGKTPLPVLNYTSQEMRQAIDQLPPLLRFNVIQLDSIHLCGYVPTLKRKWPDAGIVLDWHNIESEGMKRFAAASPSTARRLYAAHTAGQLERVERRMLRELDGHIVCSDRERDELLRWRPDARVTVIDNGVDSEYFRPRSGPVTSRIVFVGQMSYGPNVEGALWFSKEIWPQLKERYPDLTLDIVGADPAPAVRSLAGENINVTGTVPDVRTYYEGALAAAVPLRTGAGTRLKILEAIAAGVPVISTALGAEGLEITPDLHYISAETADDWTRAIETVRNWEARSALVREGRSLVESRYDWRTIGARLSDLYRQWATASRRQS